MNQAATTIDEAVPVKVRNALEGVVDPEIPVLTIRDLGILRDVRMEDEHVVVTITPTYSGCPAMRDIRDSIHKALLDAGCEDHRVETSLAPAWTTDWMSEEGRKKLLAYGIAPPLDRGEGTRESTSPERQDNPGRDVNVAPTGSSERLGNPVGATFTSRPVPCPQCGSEDTRLISEFGSTACKAMYQCNSCLEPFDHFKCH